MSNSRKLRTLNGGRLTRHRWLWTGKRRDTGATHVGRASNADMNRAERKRVQEAAR
jgi:hypothetical protein